MRCKECIKKGITIECKWCKNEYCTKCIQLEVHNCENIEERNNFKNETLQSSLRKITKEKVLKI